MHKVLLERSVVRFISKLQGNTKAKYEHIRELLIQYGPDLGMPHSKRIKPRLFELRIRGTQEVRFFCTLKESNVLIFYGFIKKTDRIPKHDLEAILRAFDTLI